VDEFRFAVGNVRPHFACEAKCKMLRPWATDMSSPISSEEGTQHSGRLVGYPEVIHFHPLGDTLAAQTLVGAAQ
jgi:hypothetical protein